MPSIACMTRAEPSGRRTVRGKQANIEVHDLFSPAVKPQARTTASHSHRTFGFRRTACFRLWPILKLLAATGNARTRPAFFTARYRRRRRGLPLTASFLRRKRTNHAMKAPAPASSATPGGSSPATYAPLVSETVPDRNKNNPPRPKVQAPACRSTHRAVVIFPSLVTQQQTVVRHFSPVPSPLLNQLAADRDHPTGKFTAKVAQVTQSSSSSISKTLLYAAAVDIVLVLVFAISGRSSHTESLTAGGILQTAWPFLASLAIGWVVCRTWKHPIRPWPHGVLLWLITVAGGMALRIASGNTAELPFVIVATIVLGTFLLGHRLLATLVSRRINKG